MVRFRIEIEKKEDVVVKKPLVLRMDNVVVMPHNGGGTVDTMKRIIGHSFDNIMRAERGEPLPPADIIKA